MPRALLAATLLLLALPGLGDDSVAVRDLDQQIPVGDASSLQLIQRFGDLSIEGVDGDVARVEVTVRCIVSDRDRCASAARDIGLAWDRDGNVLEVKVTGTSRFGARQLKVSTVLAVPAAMPLEIDVGAGDVDAAGLRADVEIDVGAGDVEARLAKRDYRVVKIDLNAGEADLEVDGDTIVGTGFVHKALSWKGGDGTSVLEIDVGAGDVRVDLD